MEFRHFRNGDAVSVIGIGGSGLHAVPEAELAALIEQGIAHGVNLLDLATESPVTFEKVGRALAGRRDKMLVSLHLGLTFQHDGQYRRTRDIGLVRQGFADQLAALKTDYADIAYIHYVDEEKDYAEVFASGMFDYALSLKAQGRIGKLGFASHRADMCRAFLQTGVFDLFMFSINPAYDLDPVGHNPLKEDWSTLSQPRVAQERAQLYQSAEALGVGITVMKPLGAGRLLNKTTSPFGRALTVPQCIQYCLDRPGVLSCVVGVKSVAELLDVLEYTGSTPKERDYSCIAALQHEAMRGQCVYCNHCLPCPAHIDIGSVHKFMDLARAGDALAREHYLVLRHKAAECVACGSCEANCPFGVPVIKDMKKAATLFGA